VDKTFHIGIKQRTQRRLSHRTKLAPLHRKQTVGAQLPKKMRGGGRSSGGGRGGAGNYTNPCLTMHQPWASLLVHGIKRIEGRSWPAPIRGRLWIHAASKVPEEETIKAMEDFYREIYALNGVTDIKFPQHYPVSRLLGCIEVVGCLKLDEVANWEAIPEGVRVEGQTDFCWLCESPQKLLIPFEMRGYQGVYNLEKKIFESALRGLVPVKGPMPVKFPLPNPNDRFSLCPGSISSQTRSNPSQVDKSSTLIAAIDSARAAATQFSKKGQNHNSSPIEDSSSTRQYELRSKSSSEQSDEIPPPKSPNVCDKKEEPKMSNESESDNQIEPEESSSRGIRSQAGSDQRPRASPKLFAAAIRGLKLS
ncbi:Activating signal cointegrator 1, partial [Linum grandiflorum]